MGQTEAFTQMGGDNKPSGTLQTTQAPRVIGRPFTSETALLYGKPFSSQYQPESHSHLTLKNALKRALRHKRDRATGETHGDALIARTVEDAVNGDARARALIFEYLETKPAQQIETRNSGGISVVMTADDVLRVLRNTDPDAVRAAIPAQIEVHDDAETTDNDS
jgi:hypothetical protein